MITKSQATHKHNNINMMICDRAALVLICDLVIVVIRIRRYPEQSQWNDNIAAGFLTGIMGDLSHGSR